MSGRLIISSKKSYTPWNAKNIERVRRDERAAKERETNEREKKRQREGELRISTMKRLRSDGNGHLNEREERSSSKLKHVNLFEDEEREQHRARSKEDSKPGILPVFLVSKSDNSSSLDEFYKRKSNIRLDTDEKIKAKNDPMRDFTKTVHRERECPSLEEKVIRMDKKSSSISTLRRRQMERDALHSKREEALRNKFK